MIITVNGLRHDISEERKDDKLIRFLREDLSLHGTKNGCGIGACGACTVLVDGKPKRSCVMKLGKLDGASILTVEGLVKTDGGLHPLQQAFIDAGAVQCGFCTPGMLLTGYALLNNNPHPSDEEIAQAYKGNLCRCTGYRQIFRAVKLAASMLSSAEPY